MLTYRSGEYVGETDRIRIPYRVKYAKQPGRPLLVFFHGGGSVGSEDLRPLWEYLFGPYPEIFPRSKRKELFRRDFTAVIPQFSPKNRCGNAGYVTAVRKLCERIADDARSDLNRVYCMGISFGGRCAWLSAYLFPDFYACAMPLMGALDDPTVPAALTTEDLAHMKELPLWVAHSADDAVVKVDRDDAVVAVLRELGAPVNYTRADGKGHRYLVSHFLGTEPWAAWMFEQRR